MEKFKIILQDQDSQTLDVDYTLNDTTLALKWFAKIKHLSKIQIDPVESCLEDLSDLNGIYSQFCRFAGLQYTPLEEKPGQKVYNTLHQIYEDTHDRLSVEKGNDILYKFHHAIHKAERGSRHRMRIDVGWGVKEGPLTQHMNCQPFYEDDIKKNNLYLPWSELGKTPLTYWSDNEPKDQTRFNTLCKPHITFRAKFYIALYDKQYASFPNQFNQFFNQFKKKWLKHHGINEWLEKDEWCAPLLAHTNCSMDLDGLALKKIVT